MRATAPYVNAGEGVASAGAPGRAQFLRWQVYLAASLYGSDLRLFYPQRFTTDPAGAEEIGRAHV